MTETTRDLIQRLANALAEWQLGGAPPEGTSDVDLINEARAYLAQSESEGLTDEEILNLSQEHCVSFTMCDGGVIYPLQDGADMKDDVLSFARALIAADRARWGRPAVEPEPEDKVLARVEFAKGDFNGPFDAALAQYCDNWFYGDPERTEVDPVDLCRGAIKLFAQALAPTPVSEKLPGPEDCSHPEGECWWFDPASDGAWYIDTYQGNYTYWLPHYALPIPPFTEKP